MLEAQDHLARPGLVLEPQGVAAGSEDDAVLACGLGGLVRAIPEKADDVWVGEVAVLEGDEHLVADLRHEERAPLLARERGGHRRQELRVVSDSQGNESSIRPRPLRSSRLLTIPVTTPSIFLMTSALPCPHPRGGR